MIQFNVSRNLSKPLGSHIKPASDQRPDFVWRADLALIGADACIVAQEQQSLYIMVFCGLGKEQFANFPKLFRNRFWQEASAICQKNPKFDSKTLARHLLLIGDEQHYAPDPDALGEERIALVMEKLERRYLYDRLPLPVDNKAAFEFGVQVNTLVADRSGNTDQLSPMESLGNLCLTAIEQRIQHHQRDTSPVIASHGNIITVDFGRNRRSL